MRVDIFTIFPGIFESPLRESLLGRAIEARVLDIRVHDIRPFADDPHRQVDDLSFGGGPGMVIKPEPLVAAVESLGSIRGRTIVLSPTGRRFDQAFARELAAEASFVLICGRYEGIDERVVQALPAEELSIGDYVLSGGEVAALVVVEAVTRLVPGVIGKGSRMSGTRSGGTGCWTTRTTRGPASSANSRYHPCCCRATTLPSRGGVAVQPSRRLAATVPIY